MTYDTRLHDLITKQEKQIQAFERHRADMWAAVQATEKEILQLHDCTFTDAPPHVLAIVNKLREDYYRYWWNDGVLLTALMNRQAAARQRVIDRMKTSKTG
ncbi:hypothetical protein [Niastella populi]|uniref:Uncharacterized protein n=1 Tax=Niastella populi TaxID=550983 RepID=A0A1V9ET12_9BACT|nr:hypothetical protein [Niastella populi]OQP49054.1 hypothetical protein A4R26_31055 [Niastella populi]